MRLGLDGLVEVAVVAIDIPSVDGSVGIVRWVYFRPRSEIWQKRTIPVLFSRRAAGPGSARRDANPIVGTGPAALLRTGLGLSAFAIFRSGV